MSTCEFRTQNAKRWRLRAAGLWALGSLLLLPSMALAADVEEQRVGAKFLLSTKDLPQPYATKNAANGTQAIRRPAGASLRVPPGFRANLYRTGLGRPRWLALDAGGNVLVTDPWAGSVVRLSDADGDGAAEHAEILIKGHGGVHGIAVSGGYLYLSDPVALWRQRYGSGPAPKLGPVEVLSKPGAFGDGRGGHFTRNMAFSRDGASLFIGVGSTTNVDIEPPPRATVQRLELNSWRQTTYASGLRNPVGVAVHPASGALYVAVNERDGLGDELVPDYLTEVTPGGFYGWPYAYSGQIPDPDYGPESPELVRESLAPDVLIRAHSTPLGLIFYDGAQFPASYLGDAFVALHGSWNAATPRGYKVIRVRFENGRPKGGYENFAVGFWLKGEKQAQAWGRPAGLALAADGSLLIADDLGGTIWRIAYVGK